FAFHRDCPGVREVLAVRFPLSGGSYVVCVTARNSPRSHALSARVTSGTPCRRETISKYMQDIPCAEKVRLLRISGIKLNSNVRACEIIQLPVSRMSVRCILRV